MFLSLMVSIFILFLKGKMESKWVLVFWFMFLYALIFCLHVCARTPDPLEPELQTVVSHHWESNSGLLEEQLSALNH